MCVAYKPAKVHINWLGFAGSMGFHFNKSLFDYILADNYVIPKSHKKYYAEKIIYLPNCYQPNMNNRAEINVKTKDSYGFKSDNFIYASFCQPIKITQNQFNIWMKLLYKSNNSVLWLLDSNEIYKENLRTFASSEFGIQSERLFFAKKVSFDDHIQRHQIIDIFLDTFPYNAHTSASDALWAGCPMISLSGETFASRVAGSILTEIGCSNDY